MELVRLLIQNGNEKFTDEATVADFIFRELQEDEALKISNQLYDRIINEVKQHIEEHLSFDEHFFTNHMDGDIRKLAADVLSEVDKYELSPFWLAGGKVIPTQKENYIRNLQSVFLFLKLSKVNRLIKNNLEEFSKATHADEIEHCQEYNIQLIAVRNAIAKIMGTSYNVL